MQMFLVLLATIKLIETEFFFDHLWLEKALVQ